MSIFDPVAKVKAYHDAINRLDYQAIEAAFAEAAVYISGGTGNTQGRAAIVSAFRSYFATYPDQVATDIHIERLDASRARAWWSLEATHVETGQRLYREGVETVTFDAAGLIIKVVVEDR